MKIQILSGNLGNQIRQYVFVKFAEKYRPIEKWFFDDSSFFVRRICSEVPLAAIFKERMNTEYDLQRIFGLKLNLLSEYMDQSLWGKIVRNARQNIILPQTLYDLGTPIVLFEGRLHVDQASFTGKTILAQGKHLGFHPQYIDLPYENIYYHAEWASRKWFDAYAEENRKELQFPPLIDKHNLGYEEQMRTSYSVGIHVRRGDFKVVGWDLPAEAYRPACRQVVEEYPNAHFFIFSDDLDWCHANERELGFDLARSTTYVAGNTGKNSYIDMQLLSMCKGMIRNGESSFSQVAGWLNPNLEFEIKLKKE